MKKKIAIIGEKDIDSLAWHFEYTLIKMGFEAEVFGFNEGYASKINNLNYRFYYKLYKEAMLKISQQYEKKVYRELVDNIIDFEPDLTIVILRNIPPSVISSINNNTQGKVIFLTGDSLANLQRGYSLTSDFDAWFVKDKFMYSFMKNKLSLNVHYLPESFNPDFHKPPLNVRFGQLHESSVVGNLYPYRSKILERIMEENVDIAIYGSIPKWMNEKWHKLHTKKHVRLKEKSKVFYGTKVNLNTLHYSEIDAGNCRLFEIAGAGGFQICDRKGAIAEYFVEDEEIVCFDTIEELIQKVKYYIKHQDEAENIAKRGHERALKEHTYEHRINTIFEIIGFEY